MILRMVISLHLLSRANALLPQTSIAARIAARPALSSSLRSASRAASSDDAPDAARRSYVGDCLPRAWASIGMRDVIGESNGAFRALFRDTLREFGDGVTEELRFNEVMVEGGENWELPRPSTPSSSGTKATERLRRG